MHLVMRTTVLLTFDTHDREQKYSASYVHLAQLGSKLCMHLFVLCCAKSCSTLSKPMPFVINVETQEKLGFFPCHDLTLML